jgi:hypothetical protein
MAPPSITFWKRFSGEINGTRSVSRVCPLNVIIPLFPTFKGECPLAISEQPKSSRCDTGLVHDLQLTWASGESESESRRAKRVREQPYDINVRDNWIIIGVREQPYVIQVCSGR